MERYPEQVIATLESLRNSGWREALVASDGEGYTSLWQALSDAARAAIESGLLPEGKSLWLLADACSMMLNPNSPNDPFKPFGEMNGMRTALPIDFQESDVNLFAAFVEEIDNLWIKARLADLVWLLVKPRNTKFALLGIDSYRQLPLDPETWLRGSRECWHRAIKLTLMLKNGAGDRLKEIESALVTAFENSGKDDGYFPLWLSDMLANHRLGEDHRLEIAVKLEATANNFNVAGEFHRARDYFFAASRWFRLMGNTAKVVEMTVYIAESWVKEAMAGLSSDRPSYMLAASLFESAVLTYRKIPRRERSAHKVDEQIAELHKQLNDARSKSLDEMSRITSPTIDISEIVKESIKAVQGKSVADAIAAFANIYCGAKVAKIREFSEKMIREHPFQALIGATHMSRDGRVVAKRTGMGFGNADSEKYKATLWAEMVKYYGIELDLIIRGQIWPTLEILRLEHRFTIEDFITIASRSPIVPPEREQLVGRALFAGYDNDFVAAIHILVPQIEHLVRWHLKAVGVKTTTQDSNGIETENGLSKLMEIPEVEKIFGEDLSFELKALFCDPFGPNLRNELAHGLLNNEACNSIYTIYAWWLGLRIVFNTFWNDVRKTPDATGESMDKEKQTEE